MKLTKMVPISSIQLLLLTMVMLLALPDCDASIGKFSLKPRTLQSNSDFPSFLPNKKVVVQAGAGVMVPGRRYMNDAKEMLTIPKAAEGTTRGKLGGRKMMTEGKEVISNEVKKEESKKSTSTTTTTTVEASKIISGASSVGNIKHHTWKGKLNMQSKLSRSMDHHLGKVNTGGFMDINADYHMAQTHPPRNN